MTRGFILGKFLPPHAGHLHLCRFGAAMADRLTVLVCSLPDDPIPGALRWRWMTELLPMAQVLHHDRVVPQAPEEDPRFWDIWRRLCRAAHPEPIDLVFASEPYGSRLAAELEARFVPVDPERRAFPVSGTAIRADPFRCWTWLPGPVRAWYSRRVCLFGPESSGKTSLAAALAARLETALVPEYGRTHTETFGTAAVTATDLVRIAAGQAASRQALAQHANRLLVEDTDALLTQVWAQMLLGRALPEIEPFTMPAADLYLLCDIDFPWVDDGTRYFADAAARRRFHALCRAALERCGCRWMPVSGTPRERLDQALAALRICFPGVLDAAPA